jgi:proline dehydrogenase
MGVMRTLLLKGSTSPWLKRQVEQRAFAQRAVRRFMPGETPEAALAAAHDLERIGMPTVLTLLGEAISDDAEASRVADHYLALLDRVASNGLKAQISVKPTQLGVDVGRDLCATLLERLVRKAAEAGNFVWVDMEATPYVDATLDLYRRVRGQHSNVGVCLQSYLYRTADDLEALLPMRPTVRLVKGAYAEPPHAAFPRKADVDANYVMLAKRLLSPEARVGGAIHGFGTHDPQVVARITDFAEGAGVAKGAFEIQMLYGIRRNDQLRWRAEGHTMRVLISYGSYWFPWYMRRLAERPANVWFVAKALLG